MKNTYSTYFFICICFEVSVLQNSTKSQKIGNYYIDKNSLKLLPKPS